MITYIDRVAVIEKNGQISITRFAVNDMQKYGYTDEDQFISWYMNRIAPGDVYNVIDESNIPKKQDGGWDKSNRNEWSFKNGKVEVDQEKVAAKESKKATKQAVLSKLKITEEEFKELIRG